MKAKINITSIRKNVLSVSKIPAAHPAALLPAIIFGVIMKMPAAKWPLCDNPAAFHDAIRNATPNQREALIQVLSFVAGKDCPPRLIYHIRRRAVSFLSMLVFVGVKKMLLKPYPRCKDPLAFYNTLRSAPPEQSEIAVQALSFLAGLDGPPRLVKAIRILTK